MCFTVQLCTLNVTDTLMYSLEQRGTFSREIITFILIALIVPNCLIAGQYQCFPLLMRLALLYDLPLRLNPWPTELELY